MINLIKWLIFGHVCVWDYPDKTGTINSGNSVVGHYRQCRCVKCGAWKEFRT